MRLGRYGAAQPTAENPAVVRLRTDAGTERVRINNARRIAVETAKSTDSTTWSRWAPLIIVGGVVAVGAIAWALKRRSSR